MKKVNISCVLLSVIISLSYLTCNTKQLNGCGLSTTQVGVACLYGATTSEGGTSGVYTAGAGIAISTGWSLITTGVPNGWNPVGCGCLIGGVVL